MNELAEALSKFLGDIEDAPKDCKNPFFNSKYASLESVLSVLRPALSKHGLSFTQLTQYRPEDKTTVLETTIMHKSGQSVKGTYPIIGKDNTPQSMGSALSYAKRYSLQAAFGMASEDDDGNVSSHTQSAAPGAKAPRKDDMPEGSRALTKAQLDLITFQKDKSKISEAAFEEILNKVAGVTAKERIPFAKVSEVLGAIQKAGVKNA